MNFDRKKSDDEHQNDWASDFIWFLIVFNSKNQYLNYSKWNKTWIRTIFGGLVCVLTAG